MVHVARNSFCTHCSWTIRGHLLDTLVVTEEVTKVEATKSTLWPQPGQRTRADAQPRLLTPFRTKSWKVVVPLHMRAMRRSVFPKCRRMHPRCSIMLQMGQEAVPQHGDENFRPFPLLSRSSPPMTASTVEDENEGRFGPIGARFNPRCTLVLFGAQNA